MRSSWRTIVAGLVLALGAAVSALVPPAHAAGITIAIDPGHGGSDPGAVANGLREKDLTLAVSLALKEELESYDGVRVVMTRTTDTRPSENTSADLSSRVDMAAAADADALVSIHFNSGSPIANGAEVWYANSSSYNYGTHTQGRTLSNAIQKQLTSLGLADRGIKTRDNPYYDYPDGSTGDYYAIIRQAREENMTGVIVEHAFVTSETDAALLHNESFVRSLGIADATGIAQAYGLSKGAWRASGDSWSFISNGTAKTGWFSVGGRWYWAGSDERTIRGWSIINGRRYFFDDSTAMVTGWKQEDGKWYYLRPDGDMATGWVKGAGSWYYMNADGVMVTGWLKDGNNWYWLRAHGAAATRSSSGSIQRTSSASAPGTRIPTGSASTRYASPVSESILRPGLDHHRPDGRGASTPICSPAWIHHEASAAASSSAAALCCGYSEDEPGGRPPPDEETAEGASSPLISSPTRAGIVRTTAWSLPQQRAHRTPT